MENLPGLVTAPTPPDAWFPAPAGRPVGTFASTGQAARAWREHGASLLVVSSDLALLAPSASALVDAWKPQP